MPSTFQPVNPDESSHLRPERTDDRLLAPEDYPLNAQFRSTERKAAPASQPSGTIVLWWITACQPYRLALTRLVTIPAVGIPVCIAPSLEWKGAWLANRTHCIYCFALERSLETLWTDASPAPTVGPGELGGQTGGRTRWALEFVNSFRRLGNLLITSLDGAGEGIL